MKKLNSILSVVLLLLISYSAQAQTDSLSSDYVTVDHKPEPDIKSFTGPTKEIGAFGALDMALTNFDNRRFLQLGATGALVLNHSLSVGLTGAAFVYSFNRDSVDFDKQESSGEDDRAGAYGGVYMEYIFLPKEPVHISIPIAVGIGGYGRKEEEFNRFFDGAMFLFIRPGVRADINVSSFFRLSMGMDYMLTDLKIKGYEPTGLDNVSFITSLKFGRF